jgi:hypothetical protein
MATGRGKAMNGPRALGAFVVLFCIVVAAHGVSASTTMVSVSNGTLNLPGPEFAALMLAYRDFTHRGLCEGVPCSMSELHNFTVTLNTEPNGLVHVMFGGNNTEVLHKVGNVGNGWPYGQVEYTVEPRSLRIVSTTMPM